MDYEKYKVSVPEGAAGAWKVERFTVSDEESRFDALQNGSRAVTPGNYTRLCRGTDVIMSDTPAEIIDHLPFVDRAEGHVLIAGLGLGMVLQAVARKPKVETVTVIDNSPDVIALVADHYRQADYAAKIQIIEADIFAWKAPKVNPSYQTTKRRRYHYIWFDIWDTLNTDNLAEMKTLHRRFAHWGYYKASWGRELLKRVHTQQIEEELERRARYALLGVEWKH